MNEMRCQRNTNTEGYCGCSNCTVYFEQFHLVMHSSCILCWNKYGFVAVAFTKVKVSYPHAVVLGPVSISNKTPYCKICRYACQILERSDNSKYKSRGFETSRDLTIRRLIGYWHRALFSTYVRAFSQANTCPIYNTPWCHSVTEYLPQ